MIIYFWNVTGLNNPLKQYKVFGLIKKHRIDVCGLLETKLCHMYNSWMKQWKLLSNVDIACNARIIFLCLILLMLVLFPYLTKVFMCHNLPGESLKFCSYIYIWVQHSYCEKGFMGWFKEVESCFFMNDPWRFQLNPLSGR